MPLSIFWEIKSRITIVIMVADLVQYYKVMGCICIKSAFLRVSLRLLPKNSRGSQRLARIAISLQHLHNEQAVPRQMKSRYAV